MFRRALVLIVALFLAVSIGMLAACGADKDEPASTLSEAERDSVLSESALPGASAVKGALAVSDSAQARADRAAAAANR